MVRLSEEEYDNIMKRRTPPPLCELTVKTQPRHKEPKMNKTEARYLQHIIMPDIHSGLISKWRFEEIKFRLGKACYYTPDFLIVYRNSIEIHEIKGGHIREDALVKFKAASERFPFFIWKMIQWKGGTWTVIHSL